MYKHIPLVLRKCSKITSSKSQTIKNKKMLEKKHKFIKDQLENKLSPETKEYLKLNEQMKKRKKPFKRSFILFLIF